MLTLYGDRYSGNCYKVQLLLALLKREFSWRDVDILKGESRTDDFLAMNPNGRVPLLKLDDGHTLAESNAILFYLADDTAYLPRERYGRALVLQWQAFEQYSHEPFIATSRFIRRYLGNPPERAADLAARQSPGYAALKVMEKHLATRDYFVGNSYSIADISLYAYTHVADEGGFSLDAFPAIRNWLARIAQWPGHVVMGHASQ
jgi:glutathione S-transferase